MSGDKRKIGKPALSASSTEVTRGNKKRCSAQCSEKKQTKKAKILAEEDPFSEPEEEDSTDENSKSSDNEDDHASSRDGESDSPETKALADKILQYAVKIGEQYQRTLDDMEWIINYYDSFQEDAIKHAKEKEEKISATSRNFFKRARLMAGIFENGDDADELLDESDTATIQELEEDTDKTQVIGNEVVLSEDFRVKNETVKKVFNKKLVKLIDEVQPRLDGMLRNGYNEETLVLGNSLAFSTVTYTTRLLHHWLVFVAATPNASIEKFEGDQIDKFFKFLEQTPVIHGPVNRIGKRMESSSICGIITAVFISLRLLGYLPVDKPFHECIEREKIKRFNRYFDRTKANEPLTHYSIFPSDIQWAVGTWDINSHDVHQAALYLLLKSSSMLRVSSLLPIGKANSPGIRLGDVRFLMEDVEGSDGYSATVLSAEITIKFEKQKRQSGSIGYKGRAIYLRGSNEFTCVVKFLFLQCLYVNAFEDDCANMFGKKHFPMKNAVLDQPLFRQTDKFDQFTIHPLRNDGGIMDRLAETLGLPRMCVSGHGLRHGSAEWLADTSIQGASGAVGVFSVRAWMGMTGQWDGGGWKQYTKDAFRSRINMTRAAFGTGSTKDNIRAVYDERYAVYGLTKEHYIRPTHPAVKIALENVQHLGKLKKEVEDAQEERMDKRYEITGSRKLCELAVPVRKEVSLVEKKYYKSYKACYRRHSTLAKHLSMYANKEQVEQNKMKGTIERVMEVRHIILDIRKIALEAEMFMKTKAKFMYCPTEFPPTEDVQMKCYADSCPIGPFHDVQEFLAHMFHAHGITMNSHAKFKTAPANVEAVKPICWGIGSTCGSLPFRSNSTSAVGSICNHLRRTHQRYMQCRDCDRMLTLLEYVNHKHSNKRNATRITNFLNYNEFLDTGLDGDREKCLSSVDNRNGEEMRRMFANKDAEGIHRLANRMTEKEFVAVFKHCMAWDVFEHGQGETALDTEI